MQSSSESGAVIYAVSVSAAGAPVTVSPISPVDAPADGFDLADDLATVYQAYKEGSV